MDDDDDGFRTTSTARSNALLSFAREHVTLVASMVSALIFSFRLFVVARGDGYTATILLAHASLGDAIRIFLMEALPILLLCSSLAAAYVAGTRAQAQAGWGCFGFLATCILLMAFYFYVSEEVFGSGWSWGSAGTAVLLLGMAVATFYLAPDPARSRQRETRDGVVYLDEAQSWRLIGRLIVLAFLLAWLSLDFPDIATDRFWLPRERLVFSAGQQPIIGYVLKTDEGRFVILNDDPRIIIEQRGAPIERDFCYPDSRVEDFKKVTGREMRPC
jgi:hypothetical protein